jgi:hypothetical protein
MSAAFQTASLPWVGHLRPHHHWKESSIPCAPSGPAGGGGGGNEPTNRTKRRGSSWLRLSSRVIIDCARHGTYPNIQRLRSRVRWCQGPGLEYTAPSKTQWIRATYNDWYGTARYGTVRPMNDTIRSTLFGTISRLFMFGGDPRGCPVVRDMSNTMDFAYYILSVYIYRCTVP